MSRNKQDEHSSATEPAKADPATLEKTKTPELELLELKNTLQRLQAEFENYRKRCDRDNAQTILMANEVLIADLLPVLDSFELALKSHKQEDEFHKGMSLIYAQLFDILEANGTRRIECAGKKFDPYYHEALLSEESEGEPNIVLEELQKGYLFHDKVLRHSKVKISKRKTNQ